MTLSEIIATLKQIPAETRIEDVKAYNLHHYVPTFNLKFDWDV